MAEWYKDWFNSPYYHILYKSRSDAEAHFFIDNLESKLHFDKYYNFCDMACGRGRHAKYLNQKGYKVWGLDLSPENIAIAKQSENQTLKFAVHDIREVFKLDFFDIMLNLFTSFGYFEDKAENQLAVNAMVQNIKPGGVLVLDYMNSRKAIEEFNIAYQKEVDGILFDIHKQIEKGFIYKNIEFTHENQKFSFQERVKLIFLEDFEEFFENAGLELLHVYGNYNFENYQDKLSDRMVMICRKTVK